MRATRFVALVAMVAAFGLSACTSSVGGWKGGQQPQVGPAGPYPLAQSTLSHMTSVDSSLKTFIRNAYGYAVFPSIAKGGLVVGGAYGQGAAFHASTMVAKCSVSQGSIGLQAGGESYSEAIFFKDQAHFNDFVSGKFTFEAGVSAVAVTAGAAANTAYSNGVAVFTLPKAGLMAAATVGGQKFSCHSVANK